MKVEIGVYAPKFGGFGSNNITKALLNREFGILCNVASEDGSFRSDFILSLDEAKDMVSKLQLSLSSAKEISKE